jgi:hypothetical protein
MFLVSELFTQQTQQTFGLSRDTALFVGSAGSGYVTGSVAATFEWIKVQRGVLAAHAGAAAVASRRRASVMHGAGMRNAVFDATFFGSEHAARHRLGLPHALSYGLAAVLAVSVDFPLDVAVKRLMASPRHEPPPRGGPLALMWGLLREQRSGAFRGLTAKAAEFCTSYAVTGWASTYVLRVLG